MRDYELNGLHVIVSDDQLNYKMKLMMEKLKMYGAFDQDLQKANKSMSSVSVKLQKCGQAITKFCELCPDILNTLPKTKSGNLKPFMLEKERKENILSHISCIGAEKCMPICIGIIS